MSARARLAAAGLALALAALGSVPASAAPPPVDRLFGCPLDAPADAWRPPPTWARVAIPGAGVTAALPPGWRLEEQGGLAVAVAPDDRVRVAFRPGRLVGADRLAFVRRALEQTELGPSHAGPRCEARLGAAASAAGGWERAQVAVYGRPLGERRRAYALYAGLPAGTLTVVLTATWSGSRGGPDLALVRRLLGGVAREAPPAVSSGAAASGSAAR